MDTITCPKCGTENPADAVDCEECGVNLKWAMKNWVDHEHNLPDDEAKREQAGEERQTLPKRRWWIKYLILVVLLVIVLVWVHLNGGVDIGSWIFYIYVGAIFGGLTLIFMVIDFIVSLWESSGEDRKLFKPTFINKFLLGFFGWYIIASILVCIKFLFNLILS